MSALKQARALDPEAPGNAPQTDDITAVVLTVDAEAQALACSVCMIGMSDWY